MGGVSSSLALLSSAGSLFALSILNKYKSFIFMPLFTLSSYDLRLQVVLMDGKRDSEGKAYSAVLNRLLWFSNCASIIPFTWLCSTEELSR